MGKQTVEKDRRLLSDWLDSVGRLVEDVKSWAQASRWSIHEDEKEIREAPFGIYRAPWLRIGTPNGEIRVEPVARFTAGPADGRVDLEAWPSLNRVMLLRKDDSWLIMTDSGVPIRQAWNRDTFVQLTKDLLAA
ncbi:MAG: hypothetical protein HY718_16195 [Planctomycetes bacterium]|nr:hypothetical protein [Planctomycetota bacterium]